MHLKVGICEFIADYWAKKLEDQLLNALAEDIGFNYTKVKYPWPLPEPNDINCTAGNEI